MFKNQFGVEETCYVRELSDGVVERGCTLDSTGGDPDWCTDLDDCDQCKGNGCNNYNIRFSYCLQCDSADENECKNPPNGTEMFNVKCLPYGSDIRVDNSSMETLSLFDPYSFDERGCYTIRKGIQTFHFETVKNYK